jgi:hypothetical protein
VPGDRLHEDRPWQAAAEVPGSPQDYGASLTITGFLIAERRPRRSPLP